jgi:SLIT-ROBO Rho GTPase activating protein
MMDPYNLAVCFGPTLLPIPPERDQVQFQPHVNEIVRTIIVHQEDIFPVIEPNSDKSTLYEKCLTLAEEDG